MALLFFGTDPNSGGANCLAVWVDTDTAQGPELVLQGKFADASTRATCGQDSPPADDEGIVRIPLSMVEQSAGRAMPQRPPALSFEDLLDSAQAHALHLELRDVYAVGEEREVFEAFLRDGSVPADDLEYWSGWLPLVKRTVAAG
jgi:hypothetical protein